MKVLVTTNLLNIQPVLNIQRKYDIPISTNFDLFYCSYKILIFEFKKKLQHRLQTLQPDLLRKNILLIMQIS